MPFYANMYMAETTDQTISSIPAVGIQLTTVGPQFHHAKRITNSGKGVTTALCPYKRINKLINIFIFGGGTLCHNALCSSPALLCRKSEGSQ